MFPTGDLRAETSPITLSYSDGSICVDFAGITSFTFPEERGLSKQLAADVLVGIALGFSTLRKCHLVGKILSEAYTHSTLIANPFFSVWLAQDLTEEKEFSLLRTIASHLTAQVTSYSKVSSYVFMPTMHPELIPHKERIAQQFFIAGHLNEVKKRFPTSHGIAAYNAAEFFFAINRLRIAFHYFRIAAKSDTYYTKSAYVRSQASGILFRLKHYRSAAAGYLQTIRIGKKPNAEAMALLADAQLHRGRIGSAVFWLQKAIEKEVLQRDQRVHLFQIQLIAAKKIRAILGESRTNIDTPNAARVFQLAQQAPIGEAIPLAMKSVFLNPSSSPTWALLRQLSFQNKETRLAQDYAIIAASLSDGNISYWMDLVVSCIFEPTDVSDYILISAFLTMPKYLAAEAYDRAKHAESEQQKHFFRDLGESFSRLPHRNPPRLIRLRDMESDQYTEVFRLD